MSFLCHLNSAILALLVTVSVASGTEFLHESDPQWSKTHPSYKKYLKLVREEKWGQAADLLSKFDTSRDPYFFHEDYAEVFRKGGNSAAGLAELELRLRVLNENPHILKNKGTTLLEQIRDAGYYAKNTSNRSKLTVVNAIALTWENKYDAAFALMEQIPKDELGADLKLVLQNEFVLPAWEMAYNRADWPAAAALAAHIYEHKVLTMGRGFEIGLACEKAGDLTLAQQFLEANIYRGDGNDKSIARARTTAAFIKQHGLKTDHWLVTSILLHESGQTLAALDLLGRSCQAHRDEYRRSGDMDHNSAFDYLNEILRPTFDQAYAKSDWATATQVALYSIWLVQPPDGKFLDQILEAIEKGGKPDLALKFCLASLWERNFSSAELHTCDPQGDPELVKRAATIAHRHNLTPDDPLVAAWLLHLNGKTEEARKRLRAYVAQGPPKEFPASIAVGFFLIGDLSLEQDKLIDALSWYYFGTYRLTAYCASHPEQTTGDSHYHEVLGVTRQARVLVKMGKPKLAADEMFNLRFVDPALEKVTNRNIVLKTEWANVTALVDAALKQSVQPGEPYREDVVLNGGVTKQRQLVQQVIPGLRKKRFDAEAVAERKTFPESSRFFQSYLAAQAEAEAAAASASRASTGRAFDFQGQLDGNKSTDSKRRCAACLGSGKAGYVTGAKYQSTTTGQEVAAPPCSSCNGTGWR
jgi:hypothetical protein